MKRPFVAPTPWSDERPHTLVVCCSDGRWHAQMMEFVRYEVSTYADLYAIPGGPAVLDPWNSSFDESRAFEEAMRLFVERHDLNGVWLIAHEGCAFYQQKHPHLDDDARRLRQVADLERGKEKLLERHPRLDIRLIYASHQEERVVFQPTAMAIRKSTT